MRAYESRNPSNHIDDAVALEIIYRGDERGGLYVVPGVDVAPITEFRGALGDAVRPLSTDEALERFDRGEWFGIKVCSVRGVAGWCRAILQAA
jgi:hypothetical protein